MYNTFHGKGHHGQFIVQPMSNLTSLNPTATVSRQEDSLLQRYGNVLNDDFIRPGAFTSQNRYS